MRPEVIALLAANADHASQFGSRFDDVQDGQRPEAVTVCCSDSRVMQDHMWGVDEPGRLFTVSNIGNRVIQHTGAGDVVSGDVLYPIEYADTELVIVVGHTGCGAVAAVYDTDAGTDAGTTSPGIAYSLSLLRPYLEPGIERLPDGLERRTAINRLVEYNVDRQVDVLTNSDSIPSSATVLGVVYDFQDVYPGPRGEVHVVNVGGERDVEALRAAHPEIDDRITRLWESPDTNETGS